MPIFRLLPGRPSKAFFSFSAAFFGGMFLFFAKEGYVKEKYLPVKHCTEGVRIRVHEGAEKDASKLSISPAI